MEYISYLLNTFGPFFLLLGLLVFIHELGHFAVARFFGVRVEVFSIGFGKTICKFRRGDTEYRISIIPLGGFVKMYGEGPNAVVDEDQKQFSFYHKPVLQRIAVVVAGPLMNLFLAFVVFWGIGLYGEPQMPAMLGDIKDSTAAFQAGLRSGDTVLAVNETKVKSFDDSVKLISESGKEARILVKRQDQEINLVVPTEMKENPNILSSEREIPQIDGWTMLSADSTVAFDDKNSSFYVAGLRNLDTITKINDTDIKTLRDLKSYLASVTDQESIQVTVERTNSNEKTETLNFDVPTKNLTFETTEKYIGRAQPGSPAAAMGLQRGDKILAVGNIKIDKWEDLIEAVKSQGANGDPITFAISRDFENKEISVTPQMKSMMNEKAQEIKRPIVGIEPAFYYHLPDLIYVPAGGLFAAMTYSAQQTWKWTVWTINSIKRVIQGEVSHKNLGGFITIGQVAKDSLKVGWSYFFQMMGIISINLFLLNLLPIPVLDGGHLVFYIIEAVRGRPVSPQKMELAFMFGFVLLFSLVGLTLFNDIQRVFFSGW